MRNVEVKTRQGPECHPIYEPHEADTLGIDYWNTPGEVQRNGQWFLTDDGFVVKTMAYGRWKNGARWLRTCTGTFPLDQGVRIHTEPRQSRHSFSGTYRNPHTQMMTAKIAEWAVLYGMGFNRIAAYQQVFPKAKSMAYIEHKTRLLVQREDVKRIVAAELKDTLKSLGIDDHYLLRGMQDIAENGDQDSVRLAAFRDLAKVTGLIDGKKEKTTVNAFVGIESSELAKLGITHQPITYQIVQDNDTDETEVESAEDSLLG